MNYYKIKIAAINKVVGSIASNHMIKGYNYNNYNSVYKLKSRDKLEFIPDFNSIDILNRAKPLDIISSVPIAGSGIIISDHLLEIVKQFKLPYELQVFDVNAIHKGVNFHYNYLYIYDAKEEEIFNFKDNLFLTTKFGFPKSEYYKINYEELKKRSLENYEQITPKKILLNIDKIKSDIFALDLTKSGYYVSEKLKKAIEEANCEGIEFIPIEELNYKLK